MEVLKEPSFQTEGCQVIWRFAKAENATIPKLERQRIINVTTVQGPVSGGSWNYGVLA